MILQSKILGDVVVIWAHHSDCGYFVNVCKGESLIDGKTFFHDQSDLAEKCYYNAIKGVQMAQKLLAKLEVK